MTVPQETDVNIVRLHHGGHGPLGTIAAQLGVHPDVVKRALGFKQTGSGAPVRRPSGRSARPLPVSQRRDAWRIGPGQDGARDPRHAAGAGARAPSSRSPAPSWPPGCW